jgi:hypothetical protein
LPDWCGSPATVYLVQRPSDWVLIIAGLVIWLVLFFRVSTGERCSIYHRCSVACLSDVDCYHNGTCQNALCTFPLDTITQNDLIAQVRRAAVIMAYGDAPLMTPHLQSCLLDQYSVLWRTWAPLTYSTIARSGT